MFTYDKYRDFLSLIKKTSETYLFMDFDWNSNGLILRHDIDLSIDYCFKLVKAEKEVGVLSTNFILMTSPFYNPLAAENASMLQEMSEWGFEIGLHFDPTCYPDVSSDELQKYAEEEAAGLSRIVGKDVKSISLHCPSVHGQFPMFDGFINAYDPEFFSNENYISDSCMSFRGKNPVEWLNLSQTKAVQMLLHPLHYQSESANYVPVFEGYINQQISTINTHFSANFSYRKDIGELPNYSVAHLQS
ncbi:hypothetical protein SAMN05660337_0734 [Maridesulfovibrio ferrireducens]|uniref:Uncharacterized protein n=1 Tax=Maridesulfovibrio ferrireducens TaxID=246191 RepID=A0A1G9CMS1_9BACT|nr:hypothetical protein [Maridesulfovibrio ferrireducens]SDK52938.1 hypothetical protein SAMN05660337_0734 [Maridesulfovibrio ferrireducens]